MFFFKKKNPAGMIDKSVCALDVKTPNLDQSFNAEQQLEVEWLVAVCSELR